MSTPNATTINACTTCDGAGILDSGDGYTFTCPDCLEEGYCPACGADNGFVTYKDSDGFEWAWDGKTPCPLCGWKLAAQVQP
jgi:predicted RNA-binding Zn-ribbon protein involved in translation (DUF1610 family)